ncbi:hypothetical protein HF521_013847 [Silurus meridionalis]|uniref:Uncharacterized protein n=1 Tax=Silurus meridionalis TaxID=175797 RepID=A0A8T0ADE0_SILME|nr:hypothetical protein HF521_013847 [Silurus meridionalis]
MASHVDRQTVFCTTKVRTTLRKDGSWIRQSSTEPKYAQTGKSPVYEPSVESSPIATNSSPTPVNPTTLNPTPLNPSSLTSTPVNPTPLNPTPLNPTPLSAKQLSPTAKSPTSQSPTFVQDTPTSLGWKERSSGTYVLSTLRKFESLESPESTPVKNLSSLPKSVNPEGASGSKQLDAVTAHLTKAPELVAPVEKAPEVTAPVANTPEVTAPVAKIPEGTAPVTPEVTAPVAKIPELQHL